MKKQLDLIITFIILLLLGVSLIIGNSILKGVLLLLFAVALIYSTFTRMKCKAGDKFKSKFFFGILLFFEVVLVMAALSVIITAFFEA